MPAPTPPTQGSLDATVTYKYGDAAEEVRTWTGLSKLEIAQLERGLLEFLLGMNNLAMDKANYGPPKPDQTYADLAMEFQVMEGADLWHSTKLAYPHVGDASFAHLEGLLRAWIARVPKDVRQKETGKKPPKP